MTEKQLHLPPLQALDPKEGTNLLQILRKRKPTAADTLTLLLSDLAVRTADRRGTYKWDGIEAATQEEYSRTVQKLNDDQLERHQRNLRVYYYLHEAIEQTDKAVMKLPARYNALKELYKLEKSSTEPVTTQQTIDVISLDIAETIRAARGLNCFIKLLADGTGLNQIIKMLGYDESEINRQFADYLRTDYNGVSVDFKALLNNRSCLYRLNFNNDVKGEINSLAKGKDGRLILSGFDNGAEATYSKGIITRMYIDDDELKVEDLKQQVIDQMATPDTTNENRQRRTSGK